MQGTKRTGGFIEKQTAIDGHRAETGFRISWYPEFPHNSHINIFL
jgi:hypothetical protein